MPTKASTTGDLVYSAAYSYDSDSRVTDLKYTTETDDDGTLLAGYHWDYSDNSLVNDEYSYADSFRLAKRRRPHDLGRNELWL